MSDLLVRLYELPDLRPAHSRAADHGFMIRRALPPEKHVVISWVRQTFSAAWASECEIAFWRQPVSCFVAVREQTLCGFAAYEATCRNFFGPLGVHADYRSKGLGAALLLCALHAMSAEGYAYAIIGGVGPAAFFERTVGAVEITNSSPGVYRGLLRG